MMSRLNEKVLLGCVVHSVAFGQIELIEQAALVYDQHGIIRQIIDLSKQPPNSPYSLESILSPTSCPFAVVEDFRGKLIIPGFVDAHCHAPQYVFSGTGMDLPLLAWLEKYTFPCEAKFSDEQFARIAYEKSIKRHLKCGTTFASYFATIHLEACKILVDVIKQVGQRAYVGKVSMDRNCPDFYIEETKAGGDIAEEFVEYVLSQTTTGQEFLKMVTENRQVNDSSCSSLINRKRDRKDGSMEEMSDERKQKILRTTRTRTVTLDLEEQQNYHYRSTDVANARSDSNSPLFNETIVDIHTEKYESITLMNRLDTPLILPCITPRFVPTCTKEIMHRLGELAKRYGLPVQSHMSESLNEIQWVAELHPESETYAGVYEQYGLLHDKAYMAHCCHSPKEEREILRRTNASVVHCASSNFMLNSGVMDVRQFLEEGIKVALGTDVAGGYSPSMLDALRQAVIASRVKGFDYRKALMEGTTCVSTSESASCSSSSSPTPLSTSSSASTSAPASPGVINKSTKEYNTLNYMEAFHLATVGGAEVLGMGEVVGNFKSGKKLDCLIVDVNTENSPIDIFEHESFSEHFQKFLFLGDDRNIIHVYVDGKCVI